MHALSKKRTLRFATSALLVVPAIVNAAPAEIFKCTDASGKVEYRDFPCDGAAGQTLPAQDNSVGTGDDLATIRAKSAALDARQAARQAAIAKESAERAFYLERRQQEVAALEEAARARNAQPAWGYYGYYAYPWMPPQKFKPDVKPVRPGKPPSVPAK
jgi:hypothetical protein